MTTNFREMMLSSQEGRSHSRLAAPLCSGRGSGSGALCPRGFGGEGCHFLPFPEPCACSCCLRQNSRADARGSLTEKPLSLTQKAGCCFWLCLSPLSVGEGGLSLLHSSSPGSETAPSAHCHQAQPPIQPQAEKCLHTKHT